MKKSVFVCLLLLIPVSIFCLTLNDTQIVNGSSPVYEQFHDLQLEARKFVFTQNTPLSVAELKFYLNQFDYDSLSLHGKALYDNLHDFLYGQENLLENEALELVLHPAVNLEGYYKTNDDVPWSFRYNFKDYFVTMPLYIGFGNEASVGADFFYGKNSVAAADPDNFWNVPLDVNDPASVKHQEFEFPRFAFMSFGKNMKGWGYNFHLGKIEKTVGDTKTGSIVYNDTFETDAYAELTLYTDVLKMTTDVVQVSSNLMDSIQGNNTERYLYIHQFDVRLWDKLKVSLLEGSMTVNPLSIRFLNPLPFMHQYGGWTNYVTAENKEIYKETNFCADFAFMFEWLPARNVRLYGIYDQVEMQCPWERSQNMGRYYPNSIALQAGLDWNLYLKNGSQLKLNAEGVYTSPYMYIKQVPSSSLYRFRTDMQTKQKVYSWIGTPFGPDCLAGEFSMEYKPENKWKLKLAYLFTAKGENDDPADLFRPVTGTDADGNEAQYYDYYPSVKYKLQELGYVPVTESNDELYDDAMNMLPTGTLQMTHQVTLAGTYVIDGSWELNAQFAFDYILNSGHVTGKNETGVEAALSVKYNFF